MQVPTATETAVKLAEEKTRLEILVILKQALHEGKSLEEAVKLVELMK